MISFKMLPRWMSGCFFVATIFLGGSGTQSADDSKEEEKQRLMFMTRKLDELTLATAKQPDKILTRVKEPVSRYTNPARNVFTHGALFLWVAEDRPVVAGTIWIGGNGGVHRELTTLTDQSLVCQHNGKSIWTPTADSFVRKPLPNGPKPAGTPALRLIQMRRQAERFTAEFEIKSVKGAEELRLLPQPLYRYTAEKGTVEGAVFALAHGSDPELLVVLELANPTGNKPAWSYAPARTSSARMRLSLDKKKVWETEYYWGNPRAMTDPYSEAGAGLYPTPTPTPIQPKP